MQAVPAISSKARVDVRKDAEAAQIQVGVGGGDIVTSTITVDSTNRLELAVDKAVPVIIRAGDVMIGVDQDRETKQEQISKAMPGGSDPTARSIGAFPGRRTDGTAFAIYRRAFGKNSCWPSSL